MRCMHFFVIPPSIYFVVFSSVVLYYFILNLSLSSLNKCLRSDPRLIIKSQYIALNIEFINLVSITFVCDFNKPESQCPVHSVSYISLD